MDEILRHDAVVALLATRPRPAVVDACRRALSDARAAISAGGDAPEPAALVASVAEIAVRRARMSLRRAINGTGIIIHTGLGRAVLSQRAREALDAVAAGHSTLELDPRSGRRGSRQDHVRELLIGLTGAEDALVVNNNAAAVLLAINTLAAGREVVISRGQLVEIGGSFRLPEIIRSAGAHLVEVGTTNRTRLSDYENALTDNTALIMRCHPSNFRITGFVEEAPLEGLVELGRKLDVRVMDDLGSGALVDVSRFGLDYEPTVQDSVRAGADLACFSGDKLLGGPQAGILVGRAGIISECRSNPMARAVRMDKLCLAALEATLRTYRDSDPILEIPALSSIARPLRDIDAQARGLARRINLLHIPGLRASVVPVESETGGGSLPGQSLESRAVALKSEVLSADDLVERFRGYEPPILGRIAGGLFLLDMRTVDPHEARDILGCVKDLAVA